MAHLGARAFEDIGGEVVQTTSFVLNKHSLKEYKGTYCRLVDENPIEKEIDFLQKKNVYLYGKNEIIQAANLRKLHKVLYQR